MKNKIHIARRFQDAQAESARIQTMLKLERLLWESGKKYVAGIDEAGRGPLAGPVVAAAVVFPENIEIHGIDDSKSLTEKQREYLFPQIQNTAVAWGVCMISSEIVDQINILKAAHRAMIGAVENMHFKPDHVLIDGYGLPLSPWPQTPVKGGDKKSYSIAAASILAKVTRDRIMTEYDKDFPVYGFAKHKGYGSAMHRQAIAVHGLCPLHRRSFNWGSGCEYE